MPKLYIFDMGGVVSRNTNVFPLIAAYLGCGEDFLRRSVRDGIEPLTTGKITEVEFWRGFAEASGHRVEADLWARFFHPEPDRKVLDIIGRLKKKARVVVGTNTIEPHYRVHAASGDYEVFDAIYASHLMGLAKPDPTFYTYILDREDCLPGEAVFVDDAKINVEAAARLGVNAILFAGSEKLEEDLASLGP
jgi:putative hydrolase of the HAD superfamily